MKLETNQVISWGLVIMGVAAVGGWIAISMITGTSSGTEVPISIISGLTGVLTGKNMAEAKIHSAQNNNPVTPKTVFNQNNKIENNNNLI